MKWSITEEHAGMQVREFLQEVGGLSRRILIAAKSEEGKILLNGEKVTVRERLRLGDKLEVVLPPEPISKYLHPEEMDLHVLYEDEAVLVLNKPAGVAITPSPLHPTGTIANGIMAYYEKVGNPHTVHVVTRLDKDTSGITLIAKNRLSHSLLAKSQKKFLIERKYQAIVEGSVENMKGEVDAPIGRKPDSIVERQVREDGKPARSFYQVKKRMKDHTLVEVELETGRTHQIRVHFSYIGHPLVGDDLYGGKKRYMDRQALHCHEITFQHPFTKEIHTLQAEMPGDMKRLVAELSGN